jgi:hypothetical protein
VLQKLEYATSPNRHIHVKCNRSNKRSSVPVTTRLCAFLATVTRSFSETYDSYTPSDSSSRTSINGVIHNRSSKETIQSAFQESISNSSVAASSTHKDPLGVSSVSHHHHSDSSRRGRVPYHRKSFHSLSRNRLFVSKINLCLLCGPPTSPPNPSAVLRQVPLRRQKFRSRSLSSLEDETESSLFYTPRSSWAVAPSLTTNLSPSPIPSPVPAVPASPPLGDGDSQPLATTFHSRHTLNQTCLFYSTPNGSYGYHIIVHIALP